MNAALERIESVVLEESGVHLKATQRNVLRSALARVAPGADPAMFVRLASDPLGGPRLIARLIEEVTVQETSFLRDREQLDAIDWKLLLDQARNTGADRVRAWSAGCATGEEAFTLALLACEAFGTRTPPVSILGTDISQDALRRAEEASYGPRSVRAVGPELRARYLRVERDRFVVDDALRRLVTFAHHNLVRGSAPPAGEQPFDLIVCRNVLIYFEAATAERIVASLEGALSRSGTLLLGAADALCVSARRSGGPADGHVRRPASAARPLRRPLGRRPERSSAERLAAALHAADAGRLEDAIGEAAAIVADDPMNARAYFLCGLLQLQAGDAPGAVRSLRGALYVAPTFGPAAFKLGRAYEALGDRPAARRAYERALRTVECEAGADVALEQIDPADITAACRTRILALK